MMRHPVIQYEDKTALKPPEEKGVKPIPSLCRFVISFLVLACINVTV